MASDVPGERRPRPRWPLWAVGAVWTVLVPFLWGIVAALVTVVELAAGRGVVNGSIVASTVIEAFVFLVVSFGVFRMARAFGPPAWFWLAGPAGYLLGGAGYALLLMGVGGTLELWEPIGVVVADALACALGAYVGARAGGAPVRGESASGEASS